MAPGSQFAKIRATSSGVARRTEPGGNPQGVAQAVEVHARRGRQDREHELLARLDQDRLGHAPPRDVKATGQPCRRGCRAVEERLEPDAPGPQEIQDVHEMLPPKMGLWRKYIGPWKLGGFWGHFQARAIRATRTLSRIVAFAARGQGRLELHPRGQAAAENEVAGFPFSA